MMQVIDNFLSKNDFDLIKTTLLNPTFPWYYNPSVVVRGQDKCRGIYNYQFTHGFYSNHSPSDFFTLVEPCIKKLNIRTLIKIKANLTPRADKNVIQGMHRDYENEGLTSILYVNTNNGYTQFKDGKKIQSVENRMLIFSSSFLHSGVTCTNQKVRCVINFNYF